MNVLTIFHSLVNSNLLLERLALNNFQFTLISKILFFPMFSNTLIPFKIKIHENAHSLDHEYATANSSLMHKVDTCFMYAVDITESQQFTAALTRSKGLLQVHSESSHVP